MNLDTVPEETLKEILALKQAEIRLVVRDRARSDFMAFAHHVYENFIEGKHHKIILSDTNCKSFFVPKGLAHGILGLDKENIVVYSCTNYRYKKGEKGILWNDKSLKFQYKKFFSKKKRI